MKRYLCFLLLIFNSCSTYTIKVTTYISSVSLIEDEKKEISIDTTKVKLSNPIKVQTFEKLNKKMFNKKLSEIVINSEKIALAKNYILSESINGTMNHTLFFNEIYYTDSCFNLEENYLKAGLFANQTFLALDSFQLFIKCPQNLNNNIIQIDSIIPMESIISKDSDIDIIPKGIKSNKTNIVFHLVFNKKFEINSYQKAPFEFIIFNNKGKKIGNKQKIFTSKTNYLSDIKIDTKMDTKISEKNFPIKIEVFYDGVKIKTQTVEKLVIYK